MRLVNYATAEGPRAGMLRDGRVLDVARRARPGGLQGLLEAGALGARRAGRRGRPGPSCSRRSSAPARSSASASTTARTPRRAAARRPRRRPSSPSSRPRCDPPGATVELPRWSSKVDYEAEVAFVIGDRCKDVPGRARRSTTSPATRCSTTCRRATTSSRRRSGCRASPSTARRRAARRWSRPDEAGPARRDRDRARPERRAHAGEHDRRPDPLDPGAGRVPVDADDARARRRRGHRHAGGRRQPARPARCG